MNGQPPMYGRPPMYGQPPIMVRPRFGHMGAPTYPQMQFRPPMAPQQIAVIIHVHAHERTKQTDELFSVTPSAQGTMSSGKTYKCFACKVVKSAVHFSKRQLKKKKHRARCTDCIDLMLEASLTQSTGMPGGGFYNDNNYYYGPGYYY